MEILKNIIKFISKKEVYGLLIIIGATIFLYNIGRLIISKILIKGKNSYEIKKRKTVVSILESIYKYLILIIAIIFILELYGVDTKGLIAGIGVAGALIGLALQDTVKDIISGISIIMENYYVVGDFIKLQDFTGKVIEFGLKSTKIQNFNGEVLVFANRSVDKVINISQKKSNIIINIPTAYEEKAEKVEKVINKILAEAKKLEYVSKNCSYLGISELGTSEIIYTISIECMQEHQWEVKRKVLRIVKELYDKEKVKIPYTQLEVHNGKDI